MSLLEQTTKTSLVAKPVVDLYELDNQYAATDYLPEKLFAPVVTHPMGELVPRARGILGLQQALMKGETPSKALPWPAPEIQESLFKGLQALGIVRFCYENEELTNELIADILTILEQRQGDFASKYQLITAELEEKEKQRLLQQEQNRKKKRRKKSQQLDKGEPVLSKKALALIVEQLTWQALADGVHPALTERWQERIDLWHELEAVFQDLQLVVQLGYDLSRGLLQSHGWVNLVKLRKLLEDLPQLQDVIKSLGRMQQAEGKPVVQTILESVKRTAEGFKEVRSPLAPMETRGVTRSDSISRMLPQEAALLTRPILKSLWHAKRSEQALLSYAVEGVELEKQTVETTELEKKQKQGKDNKLEKGPVLVCLDTSGSMRGTPETIAKALVLETLRVAGGERRDCYVYLFGSTNEVAELELTRDAKGMDKLIRFLSMSFGGGTDVQGPVELALEQTKKEKWHNADILIVSDGEFYCGDSFLRKVRRYKKERGLQVHGVEVGCQTAMMKKLCDPLHQFDVWGDLL